MMTYYTTKVVHSHKHNTLHEQLLHSSLDWVLFCCHTGYWASVYLTVRSAYVDSFMFVFYFCHDILHMYWAISDGTEAESFLQWFDTVGWVARWVIRVTR